MSIIERVADLLGPVVRSEPDRARQSQQAEIQGLDDVERAMGRDSHGVEAPENQAAPMRRKAGDPVPPRSGINQATDTRIRFLRIDPELLRQQNLILPDEKRNPIAEVFRRIKRRILLNLAHPTPDTYPNLVMVTSAAPGEGKSYCAANLALSIALEMDHAVILVDGDVARPSISKMFGVEVDKGLMDVLLERQVRLTDVLFRTNIGKLMLLQAGMAHPHATEMLSSGAMQRLLKELSEHDPNRVIVFDSPPIMAASEASSLAGQMGQVVVVVESGKTTEMLLKTALARIESSNIVGLILNKGEHASLLDGYGEYGYDAT